jgi:hypothetical protein
LIGIPKLGSHDAQQVLVIGAAICSLVLLLSIPNALACRASVSSPSSRCSGRIVPAVPGS